MSYRQRSKAFPVTAGAAPWWEMVEGREGREEEGAARGGGRRLCAGGARVKAR